MVSGPAEAGPYFVADQPLGDVPLIVLPLTRPV
jgi:hypothetical protein